MTEKIVVDGEIVEPVEEQKVEIPDAPLRDEFESDEEFTTATEEHTKDNPPAELEPWQKVDEELPDVPVATHIKLKKKLKGRISDRDDEIERLKAENLQLKTPAKESLKRPLADDFETDELYHTALEEFEGDLAQARYDKVEEKNKINASARQAREALETEVNNHYERASELVEKSGIKPEIYKQADETVRAAVEVVLPKTGDLVTDQIISIIGEGSEKVLYYLGNNKPALNRFQTLLMEDKTGMKAAIYLGQQKERLTNPKKMTTNAPAPSPTVNGDEAVSVKGKSFKKRYDKAHKEGKLQLAYNAKKEARSAGVDVSVW